MFQSLECIYHTKTQLGFRHFAFKLIWEINLKAPRELLIDD